MATTQGRMKCKIYPSAFSGEVIFEVETTNEQSYEGVAPNRYIETSTPPTQNGVDGQVKVHVLGNGGKEARISVPDGQVLSVSADKINEI